MICKTISNRIPPFLSQMGPEEINFVGWECVAYQHCHNQRRGRRGEINSFYIETLISPPGHELYLASSRIPRPYILSSLRNISRDESHVRDNNGISELPKIQLIRPYRITCIRGCLEIPLLFLSNVTSILRSSSYVCYLYGAKNQLFTSISYNNCKYFVSEIKPGLCFDTFCSSA